MRVADADILIIPGLNDSGPDHWQTRWRIKLSTARRASGKKIGGDLVDMIGKLA